MPKPVTPLCGCDVFVVDAAQRVLLIERADNGRWALPGGCQNLDDTPAECAVRECREETGLAVRPMALMGVWSSLRYECVYYPWKENVFTHLVFHAEVIGGSETASEEASKVGWFALAELPPLSDGHEVRIRFGFEWLAGRVKGPYFE